MGTVMTDFEKKIYDQIASKDGRKGRDIALALSVDMDMRNLSKEFDQF